MPASSGLDAAGPQFNDSESNEIRLHHTDADFVDAIHTDAGQVHYRKFNKNFCIILLSIFLIERFVHREVVALE